jgi:hypothetical protein
MSRVTSGMSQSGIDVMKQKSFRAVKKGKKPLVRPSKKYDPFPPRWWRGKDANGRELNDPRRDDHRAWMDW